MRRALAASLAMLSVLGAGCALIAGIPDRSLAPTFCASQDPAPALCDDFEGAAINDRWTRAAPPGDTVALDASASSPSPGQSLLVEVPAGAPLDGAYLSTTVAGTYDEIHFGVDVYTEELPPGGPSNSHLLAIGVGDSSLLLYVNGNATKLQEQYQFNGTTNFDDKAEVAPTGIRAEEWTRVEIDLDLTDQGAPKTSLKVGETVVVDSVPLVGAWPAGAPTLTIGFPFLTSSDARIVRYDNVVLDAQ